MARTALTRASVSESDNPSSAAAQCANNLSRRARVRKRSSSSWANFASKPCSRSCIVVGTLQLPLTIIAGPPGRRPAGQRGRSIARRAVRQADLDILLRLAPMRRVVAVRPPLAFPHFIGAYRDELSNHLFSIYL